MLQAGRQHASQNHLTGVASTIVADHIVQLHIVAHLHCIRANDFERQPGCRDDGGRLDLSLESNRGDPVQCAFTRRCDADQDFLFGMGSKFGYRPTELATDAIKIGCRPRVFELRTVSRLVVHNDVVGRRITFVGDDNRIFV